VSRARLTSAAAKAASAGCSSEAAWAMPAPWSTWRTCSRRAAMPVYALRQHGSLRDCRPIRARVPRSRPAAPMRRRGPVGVCDQAARKELHARGPSRAGAEDHELDARAGVALAACGDEAFDLLVAGLACDNVALRKQVVLALGRSKDPRTERVLADKIDAVL